MSFPEIRLSDGEHDASDRHRFLPPEIKVFNARSDA